METGTDILKRLADTNTCSDPDNTFMQLVLHKLGFNNAVVTCGIVYLDGRGTLENPPADIHTYANALLKNI